MYLLMDKFWCGDRSCHNKIYYSKTFSDSYQFSMLPNVWTSHMLPMWKSDTSISFDRIIPMSSKFKIFVITNNILYALRNNSRQIPCKMVLEK